MIYMIPGFADLEYRIRICIGQYHVTVENDLCNTAPGFGPGQGVCGGGVHNGLCACVCLCMYVCVCVCVFGTCAQGRPIPVIGNIKLTIPCALVICMVGLQPSNGTAATSN